MLLQLKDNFFTIRARNLHSRMCYVLVLSLVLQGFLHHIQLLGQPIWLWLLGLFLPFVNRYAKLVFNLNNLSLKQVYFYLFILCFSLAVVNFSLMDTTSYATSYAFRRALLVLSGIAIATIIFYEFRDRITSFIKLIIRSATESTVAMPFVDFSDKFFLNSLP